MHKNILALLSSNTNTKLALAMLMDKQGVALGFVNDGKLSQVSTNPPAQLLSCNSAIIDYDEGLGDMVSTLKSLIQFLEDFQLTVLCDSSVINELNNEMAQYKFKVNLREKPLLPEEFLALIEDRPVNVESTL